MKKIIILTLGIILGVSIASIGQTTQKVVETTIDKVGNSADKIANTASNAVSTVYSDGKSVVQQVYSDAKSVAPKLEEAVKSLANSLKVGAGEVWDIIVQQQYVFSWCILLIILGTIGSWFHFWYRMKQGNLNNWGNKSDNDGSSYILACVITCGLAIIGTIISGIHFYDMMTGFINPRFGAMKSIAEIASQIK